MNFFKKILAIFLLFSMMSGNFSFINSVSAASVNFVRNWNFSTILNWNRSSNGFIISQWKLRFTWTAKSNATSRQDVTIQNFHKEKMYELSFRVVKTWDAEMHHHPSSYFALGNYNAKDRNNKTLITYDYNSSEYPLNQWVTKKYFFKWSEILPSAQDWRNQNLPLEIGIIVLENTPWYTGDWVNDIDIDDVFFGNASKVEFRNEDNSLLKEIGISQWTSIDTSENFSEISLLKPTKNWYDFSFWKKQWENVPFDFSRTVNEDIILIPEFTIKKFSINFVDSENNDLGVVRNIDWNTLWNDNGVNKIKSWGYEFVEWQKDWQKFDFTKEKITENITLTAKFREIPKSPIVLNEIGYRIENNSSVDNNLDYIELYNPSSQEVNISNFKIVDNTDKTDSSKIIILENTTIWPGQYYIISNNSVAFKEKYSFDSNISWNLNLWNTWSSKNRYSVKIVDNFDRDIEDYEWWWDNNKALDNRNICRIWNDDKTSFEWKNTCQQTPNAENTENTPKINISEKFISHNVSSVEVWNLTVTETNDRDKKFTYNLATTTNQKYSNDLFEITHENKLKYIWGATDYFLKNNYNLLIEVKWDKWAYAKQELNIQVIEPKYQVIYKFLPENGLPSDVLSFLPEKEIDKAHATQITFPEIQTSINDAENDGIWTFDNWNNQTTWTIDKSDLEVIGSWNFTPNKHTVSHRFISGTSGKELPNTLETLENITDKIKNDVVTPIKKVFENVNDSILDGTWSFDSWDKESVTISNRNEEFVGTWNFTPTPRTAKFTFKNLASLPEEIKNLLNAEPSQTSKKWEKISPKNSTFDPVIIENHSDASKIGTWTFKWWNAQEKILENSDFTFEGTWEFEVKKWKIISEFRSAIDRALPNEILNLLSNEEKDWIEKNFWENISPKNFADVSFSNGTWAVTSQIEDTTNSVVDKEIEKIIYIWTFTPKDAKIIYDFESTDWKNLPDEIKNLNPQKTGKATKFEAEETPENPTKIIHEVNDGTWKFVNYDKDFIVVANAEEKFTWKWKFTPAIVTDESEKLKNYVKVTFEIDSTKWESPDTKIFFVNPLKNISLTAPNVTPKKWYSHNSWDKEISGKFLQDTVINATFSTPEIQVENKTVKLSENIPAIENFILNKDLLPEGITFSWKDGEPEVNQNSLEKISKNILVQYKDWTQKEIAVTINFTDDIFPTITKPENDTFTKNENISEIILNISDNIWIKNIEVTGLPGDLIFDKESKKISGKISKDAEEKTYTINITATDNADNNSTETFEITVQSQKDKYNPEVSATPKDISIKTDPEAKDFIANADNLPEGTSFAWNPAPNTDNLTSAPQTATIEITYSDGSKETKDVTYNVVDTEKPTLSGVDSTAIVGTDEAKSFVNNLWKDIVVTDNSWKNFTPICTSNPEFNPEIARIYTLTCHATDDAGNQSKAFTKNISINSADKNILKELKEKISNNFAENPEKITNPHDRTNAISELDNALNNPNLSPEKISEIFEKLKDTIPNRDETAPTGEITADITDPTNGDVTLTLKVSENLKNIPDGWKKVNDTTFTKVVKNNENISVNVEDAYGNPAIFNYNVTNIDKTAPTPEISSNNTNPTKENVILTLRVDEKLKKIPDGWTQNPSNPLEFTKEISQNGTISVEVEDLAWNKVTKTFEVNNIDKTAPIGNVNADTNWTNQDVTLTLVTTKPVSTPAGWTPKAGSEKEFIKIISENTALPQTFKVTDKVGNQSAEITYNVQNIDKIAPTISVSVKWNANIIKLTSVKLDVNAHDTGGSGIKWYECKVWDSANYTECSSPFVFDNLVEGENKIFVKVIDNAGNSTPANPVIVTKDTTAPIITPISLQEFNEDAQITDIPVTTDDPDAIITVTWLPVWLSFVSGKISGTPTTPWKYTATITAKDTLGNTSTSEISITIIDTTAPVITLSDNNITQTLVKWFDTYTEGWATCKDNFDTNCNVQISWNVDVNTSWIYKITYTATDSAGNKSEIIRTITVVTGETPIIKLIWEVKIFVELWEKYSELWATAHDREDGDISSKIIIRNNIDDTKVGTYSLTYNVSDSSGNNAPEVIRVVEVRDTTPPKIQNISDVSISENTEIPEIILHISDVDPVINIAVEGLPDGITFDKNLKKISGKTSQIRKYPVKVTAIDSSGNKSEKNFSINISDATKPVINGKTDFVFIIWDSALKNFDIFSDIIAMDNDDADIQSKMKCEVIPQFSYEKAWKYVVTCNVTDKEGNKADTFVRTILLQNKKSPVAPGPGGGSGGGSASTPISTPIVTPTLPSDKQPTPIIPKNPMITDILPSQNISPTNKTLNNQKIFKVNNRITDYVCEDIIQAHEYKDLQVKDIAENVFHDDIAALMMFRGLEKDEMSFGQTYEEYKKYWVVLNVPNFEPHRNVTRAEFVKMLVRSLSCRYTFMGTDTRFNDIDQNEWYAEYIKFAVENGWINGYKDGSFRPNAPITRAESAKILARAIKLTTTDTENTFTDVENNSEFIPYIEALKSTGIMKGKNENIFAPNENIPRTETSRIIYRTFFGGNN